MPEADPRPKRGRGWWIGVLGFLLLAGAMFAWGWSIALHPNGYRGRNLTQAEWTFPMGAMLDFAKVIAVELGIIAFTLSLRSQSSLGGRALLLGILMLVFFCLTVIFLMHSSAPMGQFVLLQLAGAVWLCVFGLVSKGLARRRVVR